MARAAMWPTRCQLKEERNRSCYRVLIVCVMGPDEENLLLKVMTCRPSPIHKHKLSRSYLRNKTMRQG